MEQDVDLSKVLDFYNVPHKPWMREQKVTCLVHADRNPSMAVNVEEGLFYCHSCGAHGNAIQLIQQVEDISIADAREFATTNKLRSSASGAGNTGLFGRPMGHRGLAGSKRDQRAGGKFVPPWLRD